MFARNTGYNNYIRGDLYEYGKKTIIDIIRRMSDEKVMKLLSFAKFIESENEIELLMSDEEENEIIDMLENDERVDGNVVFNNILGD